jgi:integration host factor subunit alpha
MTINSLVSPHTEKAVPPPPSLDLSQKQTVTRADLAEAVYRRVGLSRLESAQLVEMVLGEVSDATLRGENVKLSGFGTFLLRSKRERIGRNPKTGVEAKITPRKVVVFKASHLLRARVNGAPPSAE